MAEGEETKAGGGERKSTDPYLKVSCGCCLILLLVVLISVIVGVSVISILRERPMTTGNGGGGSLSTVCKDIPSEYIKYFNEAGTKYGVDPALLAAQAKVESNFRPTAGSPVGARGVMQFMAATWVGWSYDGGWDASGNGPWITDPKVIQKYGGKGVDANSDGKADPDDPQDSIYSGANYMSSLLKNSSGNLDEALGSYNGGGNWHGEPESVNYVKDVKQYYAIYKECLTGSGFVPSGDMSNNIMKVIAQAEKEGVGWKQTSSDDCYRTNLDLLHKTFLGKEGSPIGMDHPQSCDKTQPPTDADLATVSNLLKQGSVPIWHINGKNSGEHWVIVVGIDANKKINYLDPALGGGVKTRNYDEQVTLDNGTVVPYFGRSTGGFFSDQCLRGVYLSPKE